MDNTRYTLKVVKGDAEIIVENYWDDSKVSNTIKLLEEIAENINKMKNE